MATSNDGTIPLSQDQPQAQTLLQPNSRRTVQFLGQGNQAVAPTPTPAPDPTPSIPELAPNPDRPATAPVYSTFDKPLRTFEPTRSPALQQLKAMADRRQPLRDQRRNEVDAPPPPAGTLNGLYPNGMVSKPVAPLGSLGLNPAAGNPVTTMPQAAVPPPPVKPSPIQFDSGGLGSVRQQPQVQPSPPTPTPPILQTQPQFQAEAPIQPQPAPFRPAATPATPQLSGQTVNGIPIEYLLRAATGGLGGFGGAVSNSLTQAGAQPAAGGLTLNRIS